MSRAALSVRPGVLKRRLAGYVVRDADDQALAYIYSREDEARRIAANIGRLLALVNRED